MERLLSRSLCQLDSRVLGYSLIVSGREARAWSIVVAVRVSTSLGSNRCRPQVARWAKAVAAEHGFTQATHVVDVFGLCADCTAANR